MLRDEEVEQSKEQKVEPSSSAPTCSKEQEVEPSSSTSTRSKEQEVEPSSSASTRSKELLDQNVRSHLLQTNSLSKKREKKASLNDCSKRISKSTNDAPKAKRKKQSFEEEVSIEPGLSKKRREKKLTKKRGSKDALSTADHKEGQSVEEKGIGYAPAAENVKKVTATSSKGKGQKRKKTHSCKAAPTGVKKKPPPQAIPKSVPPDTPLEKTHELFRQILKKHKAIHCSNEGCDYRAISIPAMKYHFDRCGHDAQLFVCSKCNKEYTTQPGLKYHMKKAHDTGTPPKPSQEKTALVPTTSTRKAAEKAVSNIQDMLTEVVLPVSAKPDDPEISTGQFRDIDPDRDGSVMDPGRRVALISDIQMDIDSEWKSHQRFVYKPNESNRLIPLLTNKQVHHLRQEIKKNKKAKCPLQNCTSTLGSLQALVYHIPRCYAGTIRTPDKIPSLRTCQVCGNFTGTTAKLQRHLTTRHPDVAGSLDFDLEYDPGCLGLTGSGKPTGITSNVKWMSKLQHRVHYRQWLFSKWESEVFSDVSWMSEAAHWEHLDERSVEDFKKDFLDKDDNISANDSEIPKVPFAKSEIGHEGTLFMNTGSAVLCVDWLPLPPSAENRTPSTSADRPQVLAVSTVCSVDTPQPVDEVSTRRGTVQLWSVQGAVGGALESELQMCIAHRYGHVRDMKWCPFAAFKASTSEQPLGRMGLLALACGDGVARILSVPHPQQLAKCYNCEGENPSIPLWVEPAVVQALLCSGPIQSEGLSLENGPCFSIEWSQADGGSKIMAGYSSGLVNIWHLATSSPLLKLTHTREGAVHCLHPLLQIRAHGSVCSALCWYASDPSLIITGGYDCKIHVWKTDNPVHPIHTCDRFGAGIVRDIIWPMFLKGYLYADEHWKGPYTAVEKFIMQQKKDVVSHSVIYSPAPITSLSYSAWNTHLAVGTFSGAVIVKSCWGLNKTVYGRKRKEFPQKNVLHLKSTESEEPEPMDVISTPASQDVTSTPASQDVTSTPTSQDVISTPASQDVTSTPASQDVTSTPASQDVTSTPASRDVTSTPASQDLDCPTSVKSEDKVEDGEFYDFTKPPCLAVMKVQWNPNESHSQWLAGGARTGHAMVMDLTKTIS